MFRYRFTGAYCFGDQSDCARVGVRTNRGADRGRQCQQIMRKGVHSFQLGGLAAVAGVFFGVSRRFSRSFRSSEVERQG